VLLVLKHILTGLLLLKYLDITKAEIPSAVVHGSFYRGSLKWVSKPKAGEVQKFLNFKNTENQDSLRYKKM